MKHTLILYLMMSAFLKIIRKWKVHTKFCHTLTRDSGKLKPASRSLHCPHPKVESPHRSVSIQPLDLMFLHISPPGELYAISVNYFLSAAYLVAVRIMTELSTALVTPSQISSVTCNSCQLAFIERVYSTFHHVMEGCFASATTFEELSGPWKCLI